MRRKAIHIAVAVGFLGLPGLASAQSGSNATGPGPNIFASDIDAIIGLAKGFGPAALSKDPNGDPLIKGRMGGLDYSVYFYDCERHANCKTIQLRSSFALDQRMTDLKKLNEWNREKRWAKSYVNEKGEPQIELDVPMRYGISQASLDETFRVWAKFMRDYASYIGY
ncbi:MAG: YbjN domain-containing protein [Rhodomicrobium sp.]